MTHQLTATSEPTNPHREPMSLRLQVRTADAEDSPEVLSRYLNIEAPTNHDEQWQHYFDQLTLLIETISDVSLPAHWRELCTNNIYRPLSRLMPLATTKERHDEIRKFFNQIRALPRS